jgi:hypothetical protein
MQYEIIPRLWFTLPLPIAIFSGSNEFIGIELLKRYCKIRMHFWDGSYRAFFSNIYRETFTETPIENMV